LVCIFLLTGVTASSGEYGKERVSIPLPEVEPVRLQPYARIESRMISESSGIVKSRTYPGVFWTHNDSGDQARMFALDRKGELIQPDVSVSYQGIAVHGAENLDWEDIATDNEGHLYIGDLGNNTKRREVFTIYRIREPDPTKTIGLFVDRRIIVYYPDEDDPSIKQSRVNAEALCWARGRLFIISKEDATRFSDLYVLEDVGEFDSESSPVERPLRLAGSFAFRGMVTGADASEDGSRFAVLTYSGVWLFEVEDGSVDYFKGRVSWLPIRAGQCEAICFDNDALVISNEGGRLFEVSLQDLIPVKQ
jgi:hypothetical protein